MLFKKTSLKYCVIIAAFLCLAQIKGGLLMIMAAVGAFLLLLGWECNKGRTLPILLFFIPWAPLLRLNPGSVSIYTVGLILACGINLIRSRLIIERKFLILGILMLILTLITRLVDGTGLSLSYPIFLMMFLVVPMAKQQEEKNYDFTTLVVYASLGIIIAALMAEAFASYPNINRFIRVDAYLTVTRRCGFYSDANFYAAQVTAALAGVLLVLLKSDEKQIVPMGVLCVMLIYCGLLSGSKSFVLIFACMFALWFVLLIKMRGRFGVKLLLIGMVLLATVIMASSAVFNNLIEIVLTRFRWNNSTLSGVTTGRTERWMSFLKEIVNNPKVLLIGNGFVNKYVNGSASHNSVIQMVFQFGLLGFPVVITWCSGLWEGISLREIAQQRQIGYLLILLLGVYSPWFAIDILFFDDFFLFQWFAAIGAKELVTVRNTNKETMVVKDKEDVKRDTK